MRVTADRRVLVTQDPLGDVALGELRAGQAATAVCFVQDAQTNTGLVGNAVRVSTADVTGFAAATDFATPTGHPTFDLDEADLRERLPSCPR